MSHKKPAPTLIRILSSRFGERHIIFDDLEYPIKAVDFNFSPIHRQGIWKRGSLISDRLKAILYD